MISNLIRLIPSSHRGSLRVYILLSFVSAALRAAGCLLLIPLLSALFGATPSDALPWLGILTAVTVGGWIVDTTLARIGYRIGFALLNDSQHQVADRITHIPLGWFTAERTALARQAISSGGPDLVGFIANLLTPLLGAVLLPAALTIGLFFISWKLGVAAAITLPLLLGALMSSIRIVRSADEADAKAHSALTERILEFARTQAALRASRRVAPARSQAGEAVAVARGATMRLLLFQIPGQLLFSIVSQLALILLAGTTTVLAVRGEIGAPEAVALMVVIVRFLEPFTVLADLTTAVENSRGVFGRLHTIITAEAADQPGDAVASAEAPAPRIEFRDITFRYEGATDQVLRGVDFTLEPGSTTAIVGPSGSGKSTILSLIAGLEQPASGQILVDGTDVATLDTATRRALVSMVFQHPYLFDGPIRENVLVGHPTAGDDEMYRAMTLARVDEITERLPDGERSRVGEAGTALSGGERQRVSIARALVKPAPVLLIDEATSALDTENETAVTDAIGNDPRIRTKVMIAHRLSAIRNADHVLFIDDGQVIEQGSIAELTALGGRFAEFWHQQESTSGWRIAAATN
ncbi:ABC transporter ATP-binding protein [Mycobacteroides franklinii]|uniref:ABC transporter ATP-binding protein n=1 Tax=Mycobacteroides franklinii TaxID=948102 RepID=A0A4R8RC99_9MYCO|nr:ABC transporter ATP-binding protein [Mycobacteroides franklinii]ORA58235.1 iron ABC transporter permease [Mycobacteroides franklinii]TDH24878.1 ABC transporter ATP-binding protein [Mycobacteroides franklinii]TDZ42782.1 Iron import ATP-binding/permease protein IrtB [Mycobacteroides franklinii]TDZ52930.1 Iron import ATP-binding/permease protein IrtB [Mycobacteroides franklinii]TDZ56337.1 Iron import ATP-binding/permease protein IrtB [Mycobacteroides franklinii]